MKAYFVLQVLALLALPFAFVIPTFGATTHNVVLGIKDSPGIDDLSFSPGSLVVSQGDTVRWVTNSSVPHTITSATGIFDSTPQFNQTVMQQVGPVLFGPGGFLLPGSSFNTTLTQAGDYVYFW